MGHGVTPNGWPDPHPSLITQISYFHSFLPLFVPAGFPCFPTPILFTL